MTIKEMFLNRCIHDMNINKDDAQTLWEENEQDILNETEEALLEIAYNLK